MPLVPAKCTNCGSDLDVDSGQAAAICASCGSAFVVEQAITNYNTTNVTKHEITDSVVNINYSANEFVIRDGTLLEYAGSARHVLIPEGVTAIDADCFQDTDIMSANIPNSVTSIPDYAFSGCGSLKSISIPDSVTSIGDYAFIDCRSLVAVPIPASVTYIGIWAHCPPPLVTADSVFAVDAGVFWNRATGTVIRLSDEWAREVTIPRSATSIGDFAFDGCRMLTSVIMPDSVTHIGVGAFVDCTSLTSVTFPDSLIAIEGEAFYGCSSLTSLTFPGSLTHIGDSAFSSCVSLESINVPDSVTTVGDHAFKSCTELRLAVLPEVMAGDYERLGIAPPTSVTTREEIERRHEDELKAAERELEEVRLERDRLQDREDELEAKLAALTEERGSLGVFKVNRRRAIDEEVTRLNSQIRELRERIQELG